MHLSLPYLYLISILSLSYLYLYLNSRESVLKRESAFVIDLNQVVEASHNCTDRSLIVLDEFGKGTDSTCGTAILMALIKHLREREQARPLMALTTHFYEIFTQSFFLNSLTTQAREGMLFLQMAYTWDNNGSPVFLYQLTPGICHESCACFIAERAGISTAGRYPAHHFFHGIATPRFPHVNTSPLSPSSHGTCAALSGARSAHHAPAHTRGR